MPRVRSSGLLAVRAGESRPLWRQVCVLVTLQASREGGRAGSHTRCPLCLLSPVTPAAKRVEPLKGASWVGGLFKVLPLGSPSLAGETAPRHPWANATVFTGVGKSWAWDLLGAVYYAAAGD